MQTLTLTTVVQIVGDIDAAQRADILQRIEAGRLDLPMLATMRDEFASVAGDWRITGVDSAAELHHEVTK